MYISKGNQAPTNGDRKMSTTYKIRIIKASTKKLNGKIIELTQIGEKECEFHIDGRRRWVGFGNNSAPSVVDQLSEGVSLLHWSDNGRGVSSIREYKLIK